MVLVDSDVMIDLLRDYPLALKWLDSFDDEILLSGFVVMELIQGCKNRTEQRRMQKELENYNVIWPSPEICDEAVEVFAHYYLSHNLGMIDALIGQTAVALNLPLHTFNQKHYSVIPNIKLIRPYDKG